MINSLQNYQIVYQELRRENDLVPADVAPLWEHKIRISLSAGEKAFARAMAEDGGLWLEQSSKSVTC